MESYSPFSDQLMQEEPVVKAVASVMERIQAPNIVLIGKTGTGKSSLINAVFGIDLAEVGAGLPVTLGFRLYHNSLINIYDSAGYEVGQEKDFVANMLKFIHEKELSDFKDHIHLVWYLINAPSARIEHFDIQIISQLRQREIPLIIVLSQADRARPEEINGLKAALTSFEVSRPYDAIEVSASPIMVRGKPICEPFGLEELVARSIEKLPEIYADSIKIAQIVDLKPKRELSWKLVSAAAATTFSVGFVPIPIASTTVTLALQTSLFLSIASIYRFGDAKAFLPLIYKGMISIPALSMAVGVTLSDLLKNAIPLAGSVLAGGTSTTFIIVTGLACSSAFEALIKAHMDSSNSKEVKDFFVKIYKKKLAEYSGLILPTGKDLEKIKNYFLAAPIYQEITMPIIDDSSFELIKHRDYTLIIDKSPSMGTPDQDEGRRSRWEEIQESTLAVARECQILDSDGITVYDFSTEKNIHEYIKSEDQIKEIFRDPPPTVGHTRLHLPLKDALDRFFERKRKGQLKPNGETILVITDGEADDKSRVREIIIDAMQKIDREEELAISFIQIGSDPGATRFLKELDDDLKQYSAENFDIVDFKTFDEIQEKRLTITQILLDAIID